MNAARTCLLAFDASNRLAVRRSGGRAGLAFTGATLEEAVRELAAALPVHTPPAEYFQAATGVGAYRVFFVQAGLPPSASALEFLPLEELERDPALLEPALAGVLAGLEPYLIEIPYLHLAENDFIYKFRPESERNAAIYTQDAAADTLYGSRLFTAIKALSRRQERTAGAPVHLDFGPIRYIVPSHFGFCLGVKNAIERAYETLAENPGRRVFMLSELIHNPFVNEDLARRGLRYLQTDKGLPHSAEPGGRPYWDDLSSADVVIIPAFGATDDDKKRLVRKGIGICSYDATCMLVEKVWKAARAYGREGYTVVIHGKHEHEETKATFSNTRRHAQAVIVRNLEEARRLGEIVASDDPAVRARFYEIFAGRHTPGFELERDLARVAVVNQTTLLMNETREIITYLRETYTRKFGPDAPGAMARVGGRGRTDTLCYATQVNQDALGRALEEPIDAAFVIGGMNSSNTYQLYRVCAEKLGDRAFFIQSEANILSRTEVEHYVFPAKGPSGHSGHAQVRTLCLPEAGSAPPRVLITGGASCPDGIIQQVINRLNGFFPPERLRPVEVVLAEL